MPQSAHLNEPVRVPTPVKKEPVRIATPVKQVIAGKSKLLEQPPLIDEPTKESKWLKLLNRPDDTKNIAITKV